MNYSTIIAIDGPAGSGKSTIGKKLAECLGYLFFDTGVMYRAVTWAALEHHLSIDDEPAITQLAESLDIDVQPASQNDGRTTDVLVDGRDVTWEVRRKDVDDHVSQVSTYAGVRRALTEAQRKVGLRGYIVMVGRDIGTVVLPEAGLKVYLDATLEERARRRVKELQDRGQPAVYEIVYKNLEDRDKTDSTRAVAPLRPAGDAVIVNSEGLNPEQVLDKVRALVPNCDIP